MSGFPPIPLARAAPRAHAPCPAVLVAAGVKGAAGLGGDGEQGLRGAALCAPLPPPGDNQGSAEGDRDPCPSHLSPGLEPER